MCVHPKTKENTLSKIGGTHTHTYVYIYIYVYKKNNIFVILNKLILWEFLVRTIDNQIYLITNFN